MKNIDINHFSAKQNILPEIICDKWEVDFKGCFGNVPPIIFCRLFSEISEYFAIKNNSVAICSRLAHFCSYIDWTNQLNNRPRTSPITSLDHISLKPRIPAPLQRRGNGKYVRTERYSSVHNDVDKASEFIICRLVKPRGLIAIVPMDI